MITKTLLELEIESLWDKQIACAFANDDLDYALLEDEVRELEEKWLREKTDHLPDVGNMVKEAL